MTDHIQENSESLAAFDDNEIRRVYDEDAEVWYFSVIDIVRVLTEQPDYQKARKYWNKLKQRLTAEGSQSVTNCHRLKLVASDGKQRLTDVATAEVLLRLVQSIPSPKAEPVKLWLARVGYERMYGHRAQGALTRCASLDVVTSGIKAPFLCNVLSVPNRRTHHYRYSPRKWCPVVICIAAGHGIV